LQSYRPCVQVHTTNDNSFQVNDFCDMAPQKELLLGRLFG